MEINGSMGRCITVDGIRWNHAKVVEVGGII